MPKKSTQEIDLEMVIHVCQGILFRIAYAGLTQQELENEQDFWQGKLTTAEERLYNLRHGD
jgi:hypothetical protein